ncbi:MAG TPA: 50S ribosomal protein L16, partial [Syntrophobacteraceae bacterium]|nr:50S ribosomal protein L16 [Syntrophobacteraceae bacterium]HBD07894.1 50S ribosomal protein L16 [Syntrophobacteraceae bacterium]
MLAPKRIKYRKQQKGRMAGSAQRGSHVSFGDFGLKTLQCGYITS